MSAQKTDVLYAERLGIGGKITVLDILNEHQTWWDLIVGKTSTGVPVTISSGIVTEFVYSGYSLYRFVADDGTSDAFYSGFDGTNLTGLIKERYI